jgi:hypothetical protein
MTVSTVCILYISELAKGIVYSTYFDYGYAYAAIASIVTVMPLYLDSR